MEQTEYGNGLTLSEATVLLCLDDKGWFGRSENIIKFALSTALLYELFRLERIAAGPEGIRVVKPEPTGDPLLDRALERIGSSTESRNITGWIQEIAYRKLKLRRRILAGLIRRKIIAKKEYRILRVFVFKKFPLLDPTVKRQVQDHLCQVANGNEKPAGQDLMLFSILHNCHSIRKNFRHLPDCHKAARKAREMVTFGEAPALQMLLISEFHEALARVISASDVTIHA